MSYDEVMHGTGKHQPLGLISAPRMIVGYGPIDFWTEAELAEADRAYEFIENYLQHKPMYAEGCGPQEGITYHQELVPNNGSWITPEMVEDFHHIWKGYDPGKPDKPLRPEHSNRHAALLRLEGRKKR